MLSIRRVLCPIDWDEPSLVALSQAGELAARLEAELHVLHVLALAPPVTSDLYIAPGIAVSDQERFEEAQKKVESAIEERVKPGIKTEAIVVMGYTVNEIEVAAQDRQMDLIVLATHGRTGLGHFLMGSVTEGIVRHAPCPVLTLHPNTHTNLTSWQPPRKILAATDYSEAALAAVNVASDWAARFNATLQVLHVEESKGALAPAEIVLEDANSDISPVSTLIAERVPPEVEALPLVRYGQATSEILQATKDEGADLLVIATHGRTGWRERVFGSTTEHLIQSATCPVLVVPAKPVETG